MLFFLLLGNFSVEGFFAHLDNLASRFAVADVGRRAQFLNVATIAVVTTLAVVTVSRRRSLVAALRIPPKDLDHA